MEPLENEVSLSNFSLGTHQSQTKSTSAITCQVVLLRADSGFSQQKQQRTGNDKRSIATRYFDFPRSAHRISDLWERSDFRNK